MLNGGQMDLTAHWDNLAVLVEANELALLDLLLRCFHGYSPVSHGGHD